MADVRDRRLFDHNPDFGVTEYFHYNPDDDSFMIETVQDVEPLIEMNKVLSNGAPLRWGEMSHVASIPPVMVAELTKQGIMRGAAVIVDEVRFRKWLNDRDSRAFRTRPGKV